MNRIVYAWTEDGLPREFALVPVPGTRGAPYAFGASGDPAHISLHDFYMSTTPVTQAFWRHVVGSNPSLNRGADHPVENIAWHDLTQPGGFLEQLNASTIGAGLREQSGLRLELRLPTETEWEYAARGGPSWRDGYQYSGGNDIDAVAWYGRRHGDHTQPVAAKAPNQLGLYDMSGNVWEWCVDVYSPDARAIPDDGSPYGGPGDDRVLRGGCFHNWAQHCTVSKRYEIARSFHDGCIGVRLVLGTPVVVNRGGA